MYVPLVKTAEGKKEKAEDEEEEGLEEEEEKEEKEEEEEEDVKVKTFVARWSQDEVINTKLRCMVAASAGREWLNE